MFVIGWSSGLVLSWEGLLLVVSDVSRIFVEEDDHDFHTGCWNVSHNQQYNTIQYNTIQYNTIQYNTIQYNTIQYNTKQLNTIYYLSLLGFSETIRSRPIAQKIYIHSKCLMKTTAFKIGGEILHTARSSQVPKITKVTEHELSPGSWLFSKETPKSYHIGCGSSQCCSLKVTPEIFIHRNNRGILKLIAKGQ